MRQQAVVILEVLGGAPFLKRGYRLHALFHNVQDLKVGDPVKMAGVQIGRVRIDGEDDRGLRPEGDARSRSQRAVMQAQARSIPACRPSEATASVRAITTNASSERASTAALIRSTISPEGTIALFGRCPHRLAWT